MHCFFFVTILAHVAVVIFFISQIGISLSSLSDGMVVLHMPSEDNKQKVRVELAAACQIVLPCVSRVNAAVPLFRVTLCCSAARQLNW